MLCNDEAKSLMLTKKTCELSASFMGTPLAVMFTRDGSMPRTRIVVYPMPLPASEVVVTDGVSERIYGISRP